jgi:hypothetical protein
VFTREEVPLWQQGCDGFVVGYEGWVVADSGSCWRHQGSLMYGKKSKAAKKVAKKPVKKMAKKSSRRGSMY